MTMNSMKGQCMCGAVTVHATPRRGTISACHCDMCRAWTSSMFMGIECAPGQATATGPVKVLDTSIWASRAICENCGSPLWYELTADGPFKGQRQVSAGLFDDAGGMEVRLELYIDKKPHGYALAGAEARRQMTEAEAVAAFAAPQGESQ